MLRIVDCLMQLLHIWWLRRISRLHAQMNMAGLRHFPCNCFSRRHLQACKLKELCWVSTTYFLCSVHPASLPRSRQPKVAIHNKQEVTFNQSSPSVCKLGHLQGKYSSLNMTQSLLFNHWVSSLLGHKYSVYAMSTGRYCIHRRLSSSFHWVLELRLVLRGGVGGMGLLRVVNGRVRVMPRVMS